jgi:hypothetical protein
MNVDPPETVEVMVNVDHIICLEPALGGTTVELTLTDQTVFYLAESYDEVRHRLMEMRW